MRVLVLSPGNRDPASRDKLRALAGLGVDLIAGTPGGDAASDGPIRLAPVPVKGRGDEPGGLRWHKQTLRRLLTEHRPDLVQVEDPPESPLAADAAELCERLDLPLVLASWTGPDREAGLFERRRAGRALRAAAGVIGGSDAARALLAAAAPQAVAATVPLVGVALPPPAERPVPAELTVGFAGRLIPERGLDRLIQALSQAYGPWRLEVLGSGPEQEALELLVQRHGLASRVRWLGGIRREALDALWMEIDCLVVPWREPPPGADGHPLLLLEAMGHGIAPVVTSVGALAEVVGNAGQVVGSVEELTEVLQRWVSEPARTRAVGARARQQVLDRFVTGAIAARMLEAWTRVLAERKVATA